MHLSFHTPLKLPFSTLEATSSWQPSASSCYLPIVSADALRSIAISQRLLGTTEVIVIHHTDCGMLTFTDDVIRQKIRGDLGDSAGDAADHIHFLPFSDVEQSVRDDIQTVREAAIVAQGIPITGFVYDVHTGKLNQVQ